MAASDDKKPDIRDELILGLQRENKAQARMIKIQAEMIKTLQQCYDEIQDVLAEFTELD